MGSLRIPLNNRRCVHCDRVVTLNLPSRPRYKLSGVGVFAERGVTYEFRVSAKNSVDYGEEAVETIRTPDGSECGGVSATDRWTR